jgi:hypothetical protein
LVKTEILRPDPRLLPEMGAKVTFQNPTAPAAAPAASRVTVAAAALQRDGATVYVWVIGAENRVERRTVEAGATQNGRVEILAGLDGGEKLVLQSSRPLRAGARVKFAAS